MDTHNCKKINFYINFLKTIFPSGGSLSIFSCWKFQVYSYRVGIVVVFKDEKGSFEVWNTYISAYLYGPWITSEYNYTWGLIVVGFLIGHGFLGGYRLSFEDLF